MPSEIFFQLIRLPSIAFPGHPLHLHSFRDSQRFGLSLYNRFRCIFHYGFLLFWMSPTFQLVLQYKPFLLTSHKSQTATSYLSFSSHYVDQRVPPARRLYTLESHPKDSFFLKNWLPSSCASFLLFFIAFKYLFFKNFI